MDDIRSDTRWPAFCARAWDLNVASLLCLPLWAGARRLGTLSLYADAPAVFTRHDESVTSLFAALAATALAEAQRTEQMRAAVANRDLIGQAKGILMERHRVTADDAFARAGPGLAGYEPQAQRGGQATGRDRAAAGLITTGRAATQDISRSGGHGECRRDAAVEGERGAGDEAGVVTGQVGGRAGQFLQGAEPAHRVVREASRRLVGGQARE